MGMGSKIQECSNGLGISGIYRFNRRSLINLFIIILLGVCISNLRYYGKEFLGYPLDIIEYPE